MAYNPFYEEDLHHAGPPRIAFSRIELLHLVGALVLLTAAFAFILDSRPWQDVVLRPDGLVWATSFVGMATGFILHELAHKVLAQRYGHWAEFRATFSFLGLTLALAAFLKIVFAAPGAVLIQGRVTPRENGLISLVGPGVNLAIASLTFGAFMLGLQLSPTWGIDDREPASFMLAGVATVNAALGLFNLLPIGPLDGRKVLRWNRTAYAVALVASIALVVLTIFYLPT